MMMSCVVLRSFARESEAVWPLSTRLFTFLGKLYYSEWKYYLPWHAIVGIHQ